MNCTVFKDNIYNNIMHTNSVKIPRWKSLDAVGDQSGMEGNIILDISTGLFCFHDGLSWICLNNVTMENIGNGIGVYVQSSGPNPFQLKSLISTNSNLTITDNNDTIIFNSVKSDDGFEARYQNEQIITDNAIAGIVTSGSGSLAAGAGANALAANTIAIGMGAISNVSESIAIGGGANALAANTIAIGMGAISNVSESIAIGGGANALAANTIAIGVQAIASAPYSTTIGSSLTNTVTKSTLIADISAQMHIINGDNVGSVLLGVEGTPFGLIQNAGNAVGPVSGSLLATYFTPNRIITLNGDSTMPSFAALFGTLYPNAKIGDQFDITFQTGNLADPPYPLTLPGGPFGVVSGGLTITWNGTGQCVQYNTNPAGSNNYRMGPYSSLTATLRKISNIEYNVILHNPATQPPEVNVQGGENLFVISGVISEPNGTIVYAIRPTNKPFGNPQPTGITINSPAVYIGPIVFTSMVESGTWSMSLPVPFAGTDGYYDIYAVAPGKTQSTRIMGVDGGVQLA